MAEPFPVPIDIPAGVVKTETAVAAKGRWYDLDKVRFVNGRAEKIGGWAKLVANQAVGTPRGAHAFVDSVVSVNVSFGTYCKLYMIEGGDTFLDITPRRATGTLGTNPFDVTDGSAVVTVNHTSHGFQNDGDTAHFSGATAVGGITPDGEYTVTVVDANSYTVTHSSAATSTASGGGSSVAYQYELACGSLTGAPGLGWGVGRYGHGTYNTARAASSAVYTEPRIWSIDNYGYNAVFAPNGGTLYDYDSSTDTVGQAVTNAPSDIRFMFVTPERFVFLLREGMVVSWPDQDDITVHTPAATNSANTRTLHGGSKLIGGVALQGGLSMVLSDTTPFVFQYTGGPTVYTSRAIAEDAGLIAPHGIKAVGSRAYWMGEHTFHAADGGGVRTIPNVEDIRDWVFRNLNRDQKIKVCSGFNSRFREIWWHWPWTGNTENSHYVAVNIDDFSWITGTLARSAATRWRNDDGNALTWDSDGYTYEHDGDGVVDGDGSAIEAYIESGLLDLMEGRYTVEIDRFIPDTLRQTGDLSLYVYTQENPKGSVLDSDTKTVADSDEVVDLHVSGKHFGFKLTSNAVGGDFRLGRPRIKMQQADDR